MHYITKQQGYRGSLMKKGSEKGEKPAGGNEKREREKRKRVRERERERVCVCVYERERESE
jgi:hypothetical protein